MYRLLLRLLFLVPPERVHHLVFATIRLAAAFAPTRALMRRLFTVDDPVLQQQVFGVDFPAPLGLAAGFDKDAAGVDAWGPLGFGFAEVGTVTAQPQPGNPQPRLFRLPEDHALINRMGFNNHGAGNAANHLRHRRPGVPIGANIGKTKIVDATDAPADYRTSAALLAPLADFLVVNVSSPNTPGLRDLQAVESLRPLLTAVLEVAHVPVLVKIAPDLSDADVDARRRPRRRTRSRRHRRHQHDHHPRGPAHRRRARSRRSVPAGCPGRRSLHVRWRCCGGCTSGSATGWCSCRSAGSSPSTTPGRASSPGRRWCRHTPASSTAARSGCAGFTADWPLVFAPKAIRAWPMRSARDTLPADNQDRSH